jgi:hypothetical protein
MEELRRSGDDGYISQLMATGTQRLWVYEQRGERIISAKKPLPLDEYGF